MSDPELDGPEQSLSPPPLTEPEDDADDKIVPDPPVPAHLGAKLDEGLKAKLHERLLHTSADG